jgi:NAD+ synthase (glutamine-hydrolysing)
MRIALAQLNPLIGDLQGNAATILAACRQAAAAGADLVLTPELSLWGYPPRDLLLRPALLHQQRQQLERLAAALPERLGLLVGMADPLEPQHLPGLANALALVQAGQWRVVAHKRLLPSYDVFDERRYFRPGDQPAVLTWPGAERSLRLGLSICEDLWVERELQEQRLAGVDPIAELAAADVDLLVNLSASPYGRGKLALRQQLAQRAATRLRAPVLYLNQVGGNDELVFDGASFVLDADGRSLWQGPVSRTCLAIWDSEQPAAGGRVLAIGAGRSGPAAAGADLTTPVGNQTTTGLAAPEDRGAALSRMQGAQTGAGPAGAPSAAGTDAAGAGAAAAEGPAATTTGAAAGEAPTEPEQLLRALVLGVADYARKCGFSAALLGLSGGIDSALVAVIACAALGAQRVTALRLPSPWSSRGSLDDAQALADRLQMGLRTVPIAPLMQAFDAALAPALGQVPQGVTAENLQSRIRGTALMALANQSGALLLSTGNKSELAVGYCTLYGDMNGGLAVIGDLYKTTVFELCDWLDSTAAASCRAELGLPAQGELIGATIRHKPPSAELRPDQRDSDTLPDYAVLDPLLRQAIERMASPEQLIAAGADPELAQRVQQLLQRAEFKRRQAPPVIKVSSRSFGGGWRMPIAAA